MTPLRLITVLPLSAGARSILKLRSRAVAVCLNMSLLTQRITSPTRMLIGVGPNFILSMITICVLGAAATDPGDRKSVGEGKRVLVSVEFGGQLLRKKKKK